MFYLHTNVMKVQNTGQISFKSAKNPTLINNKELDRLFMKNNFYKETDGSYNKLLSLKDVFFLHKKTGTQADHMADLLTRPVTEERSEAFKGFLTLGKTKEFITKNFLKLFGLFSVLNCNTPIYESGEAIYSHYKDYSELFRNVITNPPKKSSVFDSIRRYKGVDCGKITGRMRGTYDLEDKRVDKEIKDIKKYLDTQVIKEPVTLYRGEGLNALKDVKINNDKSINFANMLIDATKNQDKTNKLNEFLLDNDVVVTQPSFMSTSMNSFLANDFGRGQIMWELKTAPNTKAGFIEPLQIKSYTYEDEILVQAGSKIKIKEAKFDENSGCWNLKGEVFN